LYCEDVDLEEVADKFGTPLYVYSAGTILDHYRRLRSSLEGLDHLICYAAKANSNRAVLRLLADEGAGFDIVSGGELFRVLAAGGKAARCTFAGVGKSRDEIEYALSEGVFSFNVESEDELDYINRIAAAKNVRAPIALRVNPDVTLRRTSTSRRAGARTNSGSLSSASARSTNPLPGSRTSPFAASRCTSAHRSQKPSLSPRRLEKSLPSSSS
jgi:diaminopimelate decarboxylase